MSDKAEKAEKSEAKAAAKGGKGKLFLILGLVALLAGGGGGAWWFMHRDAGEGGQQAKEEPALPPVFVALDPFTVNLQPEASGTQYMQVGITVKVAGQAAADKLKELMPEVRNRLLLVLSAKKASELLAPQGKDKLALDLQSEITALLDPAAAKKQAAPREPAKPAVTVAAAPAETGTDAAEQNPDAAEAAPAEGEPAAAAPAPAAAPAAKPAGPVLSVLFTSLIIQ